MSGKKNLSFQHLAETQQFLQLWMYTTNYNCKDFVTVGVSDACMSSTIAVDGPSVSAHQHFRITAVTKLDLVFKASIKKHTYQYVNEHVRNVS